MASLDKLLAGMEGWRASDLFVTEGRPPRVRIDGELRTLQSSPTTRDEIDALLDRLPGARERYDETGDLDVGYASEDGRRFRVNVARTQGKASLVARALPSGELKFADLALPEAVIDLLSHPRGLLLVAGATGSGKSTTLAAMVHHLNGTRPVHIVTVEDPIEFVHRDLKGRVTQREVGSDTPSFHAALRQVVRQSPDVILIGELRDAETMQVALSAALTGHLVLATLHTVDVTQTLQRILTYFPEEQRTQAALDLSLALRGIVCQRLLPKASGGRVVAVELLTNTPAAARLLHEQRVDELLDLVRADPHPGMVTFNEALVDLYQRGVITYEAGFAHASNPDEFALWAKGMAVTGGGMRVGSGGARSGLDMKALLEHATAEGASDLHLSAGRPPLVRVAGELRPLTDVALSDNDVRMLLLSIMSVRQRSTYELDHEVDFALSLGDGQRFRVNAYYRMGHYAAALRAIQSAIPSAEELGIPETVLRLAERPQGLLLVVGPTGSGKSTTLACLVDRINRSRACRILTVEDPVEYVHEGVLATIDQREVGADTKSFAAALKYVLRQDPDVILVGEMRDLETVSAALTAAETGHLVLATLHTNDAVQATDRVVDVFPPHQQPQVRSQLAACLLGVVSQRLLQKRDEPGRVGAFEVLVGTPAIRTLIRDNKGHQAYGLMEAARRDGCVTMDQALQELVTRGAIGPEEAARFMRGPAARR